MESVLKSYRSRGVEGVLAERELRGVGKQKEPAGGFRSRCERSPGRKRAADGEKQKEAEGSRRKQKEAEGGYRSRGAEGVLVERELRGGSRRKQKEAAAG